MISFEDVYKKTSTISDESIFHPEECRAYYDLCCSLPDGASVLEIGLFYGRSTSVIAPVAAYKGFHYVGVDPFTLEHASDGFWNKMVRECGTEPILLRCKSQDADLDPYAPFDLVLIDGDHSREGVAIDCRLVLPRVKPGGYLLFHDWTSESEYPHVMAVASAEIQNNGRSWSLIRVDRRLATWRLDD